MNSRITCDTLPVDLRMKREYPLLLLTITITIPITITTTITTTITITFPLLLNPPLTTYETEGPRRALGRCAAAAVNK